MRISPTSTLSQNGYGADLPPPTCIQRIFHKANHKYMTHEKNKQHEEHQTEDTRKERKMKKGRRTEGGREGGREGDGRREGGEDREGEAEQLRAYAGPAAAGGPIGLGRL